MPFFSSLQGSSKAILKGLNQMRVAYVRVSTEVQNEVRQIEALKLHDIQKWFTEKISGKNRARPQLKAMMDFVREGDMKKKQKLIV